MPAENSDNSIILIKEKDYGTSINNNQETEA